MQTEAITKLARDAIQSQEEVDLYIDCQQNFLRTLTERRGKKIGEGRIQGFDMMIEDKGKVAKRHSISSPGGKATKRTKGGGGCDDGKW